MSALMPYAAYSPMLDPRITAAGSAAKYIYDHPAVARKAARGIKKAWNRYKGRKPARTKANPLLNRVGENPGTHTAKRHVAEDTDAVDFPSRSLFAYNLTDVPQGTTTNNINERQRQVAYISGFHICMELKNLFANDPLYFNIALVVPKSSSTVNGNDFFRGSGTDRSLAFDTTLSANEFHCLPLNADKFVILKHNRYTLAPSSSTVESGNMSQFKVVDFYVPFKRQLRWRDNTSALADNGNAYVIFWCDAFQTSGGTAAVTTACKLSKKFITYFREPSS